MTNEIMKENEMDSAADITGEKMAVCWDDICKEINQIPSAEFLTALYQKLGIKSQLSDIAVENEKEVLLLTYSPCVRNRLTLMRLRKYFL